MGVMHRDLKLENFLLTDPSDAGATIKVSSKGLMGMWRPVSNGCQQHWGCFPCSVPGANIGAAVFVMFTMKNELGGARES
jgi:serine/threonine protein kinase